MRYKQKFYYWCREAVSKIAYIPDMNKVYNELFEHLLDRHAYFMAKGMDEDTAADKTIEAMGDPKVIAPQLAAIHRPGWAYAMVVTRIAVILLLLVTLVSLAYFANDQYYLRQGAYESQWDPFSEEVEQQLCNIEPDVKSVSDGYTFTVEKTAVWDDRMVIRLKATNPRPWARTPTAPLHMWAQDSNGTRYISHSKSGRKEENAVFVDMEQYGLTTYYYNLYLYGQMEDIRWLTLCYDRDGRNILLHIDLTEG